MEPERYLITTADERTWKFDRPAIFLGEWCRRYDRQHVWSGMDAIVALPYGLGEEEKRGDVEYVAGLSDALLGELAAALNQVHGTEHSLRYWRIVLGHWLIRCTAMLFNRHETVKQALARYRISGTTVLSGHGYSPATADSEAFLQASHDNVWNHVIYSRLIDHLGSPRVDRVEDKLGGATGFVLPARAPLRSSRRAKRLARSAAERILGRLSRETDAFISRTYLPPLQQAALELSLGQIPQAWPTELPPESTPSAAFRQRLPQPARKGDSRERYIRSGVFEMIPCCYLEGFASLKDLAEGQPWPSRPKFIFTSNRFDTDEVFKVWCAGKVERGHRYFTGQHGNAYGTHFWLGCDFWPELSSSDRFISWGGEETSRKAPAFIFTTAARKPRATPSRGGLLLIELCLLHRVAPYDSYAEFAEYQEEQFRFVEALPKHVRHELTVRLHAANRGYGWFDEERWRDRSPETRLESGAVPVMSLIDRSRLVVHSYDSTGLLETLALNIPTTCFWLKGASHVVPSEKEYYEPLKRSGILAESPEEAARLVASRWNDVDGWWRSAEVQKARVEYCDRYARTSERPVRTLRKTLENVQL